MPEPSLPPERLQCFDAALRNAAPALTRLRLLGDGYVTQAWMLSDGVTVARIPKFEWCESDLGYEVPLLRVLEDAGLPVETPREARLLHSDGHVAASLHRFVAGAPLAERAAAVATAGLTEQLARDLGRFLSVLHGLPLGRFELTNEPWPKQFDVWVEGVRPHLGVAGSEWLDGLRAQLDRLAPPPGAPVVLTHGDLWRQHMLLDEHDRLHGVIDFGLAGPMDPAWDFRSFVAPASIARVLGADFGERVLGHYEHALDERALERAEVYYHLDDVGDAYYEIAFLGGPGDFLSELQERFSHAGNEV